VVTDVPGKHVDFLSRGLVHGDMAVWLMVDARAGDGESNPRGRGESI
jgi:hypothetical protein